MRSRMRRLIGVTCSLALTAACTGAMTAPSTGDSTPAAPTTFTPAPTSGPAPAPVVTTPSPYKLVILPYDNELGGGVPGAAGVGATAQFLDGPRAGERFSTGDFAQLTDVMWPVTVRLSADGYTSKDVVLAESTGHRRNPISPLYDFSVPMTFAGDPSTDSSVRTLTRDQMESIHRFTVAAPGPVTVRTWWAVDYNDQLFLDLSCNGQLLKSASQQAGSSGAGFTQNVPSPGPCELRVRQFKSDAGTHYRVAISYPR